MSTEETTSPRVGICCLALCASLMLAGCANEAQTKTAWGAGIGALAGQAIGGDTGATLLGAGIGAAAGYVIGNEQDKKKTQAEIDSMRQEMNTVTVNITNSNGSVSQVKLTKQGTGYVGPRGEFYDHLPTEAELKPVYGF